LKLDDGELTKMASLRRQKDKSTRSLDSGRKRRWPLCDTVARTSSQKWPHRKARQPAHCTAKVPAVGAGQCETCVGERKETPSGQKVLTSSSNGIQPSPNLRRQGSGLMLGTLLTGSGVLP